MDTTTTNQTIDPARFGRALRAIRHDRGMSQKDVADAVGMSISQISRIELGNRQLPNLGNAVRIAQALGVTVDEMIRPGGPAW